MWTFLVLACVRRADLEALEMRVALLEARVASSAAAGPTEAEEAAARDLSQRIDEAMEARRYDEARSLVAELRASYPATRAAKAADRTASLLDVIGRDAPALQVSQWYQGAAEDLGDARATLIFFFEVWCPHCRTEAPKVAELSQQLEARGLRVLALTKRTRDVTDENVEAFIRDNGWTFPVAREDGAMTDGYAVVGIPAAAIVVDGTVAWRGHPATLDAEAVEAFLR